MSKAKAKVTDNVNFEIPLELPVKAQKLNRKGKIKATASIFNSILFPINFREYMAKQIANPNHLIHVNS